MAKYFVYGDKEVFCTLKIINQTMLLRLVRYYGIAQTHTKLYHDIKMKESINPNKILYGFCWIHCGLGKLSWNGR